MADPDPFAAWFEARRLYGDRGEYPLAISSALRLMPQLLSEVRRAVEALAPERALEVGPGDCETIGGAPFRAYVDLVAGFLRGKSGARVLGDVRRLPLKTGAFDLAVANDVFTHVAPADRAAAIAELARVASRVLIFNPEPGTSEVAGSAVPTEALERELVGAGFRVAKRRFLARPKGGDYVMVLITAVRTAI